MTPVTVTHSQWMDISTEEYRRLNAVVRFLSTGEWELDLAIDRFLPPPAT